MAAHACYPMKIDVLMDDAVPATVLTNYPISVYCVVDDRCDPTFPVKPISEQICNMSQLYASSEKKIQYKKPTSRISHENVAYDASKFTLLVLSTSVLVLDS